MKINWFTVIAQAINFLVLVWLLKRFLYKPILKTIDEREKKIALQLKDAEDKKSEATKEQNDYRQKNEDFDQLKKGLMDKVIADSNTERDKLLETTKKEAGLLRLSLEKSIRTQLESQNNEDARRTEELVFSLTRKALTGIASATLEEQSVNAFIHRLDSTNEEERQQFINAFKSNANDMMIRSAFDLPEKQQEDLSNAVDKVLEQKVTIQFKTAPELINGIELTANGYKLGWSLSEYLHSLQQSIPEKT
jgi:F-type H+-transporting ATPase subunit b